MNSRVGSVWWTLKIALGLAPLLAGLDKFFNVLTNWSDYLNPVVLSYMPLDPATFMRGVGVVEILVGALILTRWTRLGAYIAAIWLIGIALNLITMGRYFDIAVRDLVLSVSAFSLGRLTAALRSEAEAPAPSREHLSHGGLLSLKI